MFFQARLASLLWFGLMPLHSWNVRHELFCTCHSFWTRWMFYSSRCNNTCWDSQFHILNGTMKCPNHVTLGCPLSSPTFWKSNGSFLSPIESFFANRLHEQKVVLLLVNIPLDIMWACFCSCASPRIGIWLLICPNTPTFRLSLTHFIITLCTCFGLPHPKFAHLS